MISWKTFPFLRIFFRVSPRPGKCRKGIRGGCKTSILPSPAPRIEMGYLSSTTPTLLPSKSSRTPYTQQGNFLLNETSRQSQHSGARPPFRITSSFGGNKVHTVYWLIAMALAILYSTFLLVALSDFQSFDRTDSFDIEAILEPVYSSAVARRGIFLPCRPGGVVVVYLRLRRDSVGADFQSVRKLMRNHRNHVWGTLPILCMSGAHYLWFSLFAVELFNHNSLKYN